MAAFIDRREATRLSGAERWCLGGWSDANASQVSAAMSQLQRSVRATAAKPRGNAALRHVVPER